MVDPLGLTLFLIGLAFLLVELLNPGYFIGVAGTTGLIVGAIQMVWPAFLTGNAVTAFVVVPIVAALSLAISIVFYRRFAPPTRPPETHSSDGLMGKQGKVVTSTIPDSLMGKVRIEGIVWSATSAAAIPAGTDVVVTKVEGVHVFVESRGA